MKADSGKITTILGRNGVGKTSLLKAIIGLEAIKSGNIFLNKNNITKFTSPFRAYSGVGYVPQGREIFSLLNCRRKLTNWFLSFKKVR